MSSALSLEHLARELTGEAIALGDPQYDAYRTVWNAMIDRRPAIIVRCATSADAGAAIRFARAQGLEIAVRGGGHNIAGHAVCDGGLVIDLSAMRQVDVDPRLRRATVEPGATLGDLDRATQAHGLAVPVGINSTTGIAGLTLGGGFGWLTRQHGMTIDNLRGATMILADGSERRVSESEHADLFWGIRGGGGNFGIVTRFEFELHPVGPEVFAGLIVFPFDQARQVLTRYREYMATAPEALNVWVVLRQAPPLPFLPASVHGREVVALAVFHKGPVGEAEPHVEALRGFGSAHGAHVGAQPYTAWQQAFDPLLTPGARNYWKSHNFTALEDGALEKVIEFAGRLPTPECEIFIGLIAGAPNRVAPEAMAYGHRDARFVMNVHGRWQSPDDDARGIAWSRDFFDAAAPFASAGAYINFLTGDETDRIAAAFGSNYSRLVALKRQYDPENVFHHNQNIRP